MPTSKKNLILGFLICFTWLEHEGVRVCFDGGGQGIILDFFSPLDIQLEAWQAVAGIVQD